MKNAILYTEVKAIKGLRANTAVTIAEKNKQD